MGKYGKVARRATELLRDGHGNAEDAWREVAEEIFAGAPASQCKTCPREAFLGLCQAGLLAGVPSSRCGRTTSGRNRRYATVAVELLRADPGLANENKVELWKRVLQMSQEDLNKKPNAQMDVVLTLWAEELIDKKG